MSLETPVGVRDARDVEDARLLETGEHELLLATYLDTIVDRCRAKVYGPEAEDVAQSVVLRLWSELGTAGAPVGEGGLEGRAGSPLAPRASVRSRWAGSFYRASLPRQ